MIEYSLKCRYYRTLLYFPLLYVIIIPLMKGSAATWMDASRATAI